MVDQSARDAYEKAVEKKVIKDGVLENASHGAVITYSLFHNLQNPLFSKHDFKAEEFVHEVGNALEIFSDTLNRLRSEMLQNIIQERREFQEELKGLEKESESLSLDELIKRILGGSRGWHKDAEENEDSLPGRLAKMVTDTCLGTLYFNSKVDGLRHGNPLSDFVYVPGSTKVNDVALLNVRAMVMDQEEKDDNVEYPEFRASEISEKELGVAAQVDVLFEMSQKLSRKTKEPHVLEEIATTASIEASKNAKTDDDDSQEVITYTNLGVAVFEGWLYNPKSTDGPRWKVSVLRQAFEFPHHQATITTGTPS